MDVTASSSGGRSAGIAERCAKSEDGTGSEAVEKVREALHSSTGWENSSKAPLCREEQYETLSKFVEGCFEEAKGGGAYLSGVPGTGKSLAAHAVLRSVFRFQSLDMPPAALISINCMGLPDARSVYRTLLQGFSDHCRGPSLNIAFPCRQSADGPSDGSPLNKNQADAKEQWEAIVMGKEKALKSTPSRTSKKGGSRKRARSAANERGMIVVLLDEMDGLISKDSSLIYDLFKLAKSSSRFVLIGAANSLDLTERVMPKLQQGCQPKLVVFPAYRASEASKLVKQRLEKCSDKVFDEKAIELCARKVSAHTGDMRHVLEACTSAVNAAISATGNTENRGPYLVGPREILQTLGKMQDARGSFSTREAVKALPKSQQVLLFTMWQQSIEASKTPTPLMTRRNSKGSTPPSRRLSRQSSSGKKLQDLMKLGNVYVRYSSICTQLQVHCNPLSDVYQMASCLHDAALIELETKRVHKEARISLRVEPPHLQTMFKEHVLFRDYLSAAQNPAFVL
ncbi:hypothetical protein BSKO_08074 [Bryopsis sp. KO-2023]|nr:hypothetical protein BSKO_08074 [Bryopsis sp. KO-2023]